MQKIVLSYDDLEVIPKEQAPLVDIPNIVTDEVRTTSSRNEYLVFKVHTDDECNLKECDICHSSNVIKDGFGKPRVIHDVTRNNCRVDLLVKPRRMKCKDCGARWTTPIPGIEESRSMTTRLLSFLRTECMIEPLTVLSERSGLSLATINVILDEECERFEAERRNSYTEAPTVLGIDEKHLNNDMRGILVNVETGKLLDILEKNDRESMINGIKGLNNWNRNIKVVTLDMNNAYLSWLQKLLPDTTFVIDKFHVIKDINQHVGPTVTKLVEYRRELITKIADDNERLRQSNILNTVAGHSRLFHFSAEKLVSDEKARRAEKVSMAINEFGEFRLLYELRHALETMYECSTYEEASEVWQEWIDLLPPVNKKEREEWGDLYSVDPECFKGWIGFNRKEFQSYAPYILNYFKPGCQYTNAAAEGLNRLIDQINNAGSGYSFRHLRGKCLFASLIHERKLFVLSINKVPIYEESGLTMGFVVSWPHDISSRNRIIGFQEVYYLGERDKSVAYPEVNIYEDNEWISNIYIGESLIENGYHLDIDSTP